MGNVQLVQVNEGFLASYILRYVTRMPSTLSGMKIPSKCAISLLFARSAGSARSCFFFMFEYFQFLDSLVKNVRVGILLIIKKENCTKVTEI